MLLPDAGRATLLEQVRALRGYEAPFSFPYVSEVFVSTSEHRPARLKGLSQAPRMSVDFPAAQQLFPALSGAN